MNIRRYPPGNGRCVLAASVTGSLPGAGKLNFSGALCLIVRHTQPVLITDPRFEIEFFDPGVDVYGLSFAR
jgi:hypothetical protein